MLAVQGVARQLRVNLSAICPHLVRTDDDKTTLENYLSSKEIRSCPRFKNDIATELHFSYKRVNQPLCKGQNP
jgi:hypothetical protein